MKRLWLHWRDNKTGEEGWYEDKFSLFTDGSLPFWWDEGNGSCDCNREIMFTKGEELEVECGEGRFDILELEWREDEH